MKIKSVQSRVSALIVGSFIAHKRVECGISHVNSETYSMLVTFTFSRENDCEIIPFKVHLSYNHIIDVTIVINIISQED